MGVVVVAMKQGRRTRPRAQPLANRFFEAGRRLRGSSSRRRLGRDDGRAWLVAGRMVALNGVAGEAVTG